MAEQKVHFFSSAHMRGDVIAAQLAIEEGVTIVGNCDISPDRDKAVTSPAARAAAEAPAAAAEPRAEEKKDGQKDFGSLLGKTFGKGDNQPAVGQPAPADRKPPVTEKKDK